MSHSEAKLTNSIKQKVEKISKLINIFLKFYLKYINKQNIL